jgi:hypothetical protein
VRRRSLLGLGALAALIWPSWRAAANPFTDLAARHPGSVEL